MGFSVKIAPGVRVRASSRGLRTSIGPRAARLHVGSGRSGVSTGLGPVGYYTSVGGRRRSAGGGQRVSTGSARQSLTAATKAEQAEEAATAIRTILDLHRQPFPAAAPLRAPEIEVPPLADLLRRHRKAALAGISIFRRARRTEAKRRAAAAAEQEHARLTADAARERAENQARLDEAWRLLRANDPDTVMSVLATAFEDNEAAAAPVGVEGEAASVVVHVPELDAVPERMPGVTAAGNVSLRRMTKTQRNDLYALMVSGFLVVTVKEAFAVAPGLGAVGAVAVRSGPVDAYGRLHPEAVAAAHFTRESLDGIRWDTADALQVVEDASTEHHLVRKGAARELHPLDVAENPDVAAALSVVDLGTRDED